MGLGFLSVRKRRYGSLDSMHMYLGKRQKVHVHIMRVEVKVLKKAVVGNERFEMHREMAQQSFMYAWVVSVTSSCSVLQ